MAVDPTIAAFFKDLDASSVVSAKAEQIAAPIVRGEDVTPEELMTGGGLRVVQIILDRSPSMEPVGDMLREEFNTEFVPAIKDGRQDDISALRIGGLSFSSDHTPIWVSDDGQGNKVYYHSLDKLPELSCDDYDPKKGFGTALDEAIEQGTARAIRYAADQQSLVGSPPDVDILVLTDGADNDRQDHSDVKRMILSRNKGRVRFIVFFFETKWGLEDPKTELVERYGFDPENVVVFKQKQGETREERAHRFRMMLRVMSRVSASKGNSAIQAAAAVQATAGDDDGDIV